MMSILSKWLAYPAWDIKDGSSRLIEWRKLERQQWWSRAELEDLQWRRLQDMVAYAAQHSPYYRERLIPLGLQMQRLSSLEQFRQVPVTTKADIRNNANRFISDHFSPDQLVGAKTGGSTGVALNLFFDRRCQNRRNAAQLLADRWAGWDLGVKKAAIWGNPPTQKGIKQRLRHHLLDRTIYLDTMDLSDHTMGQFAARWRREQPGAIFGHAHSIYTFARYVLDQQIVDLHPKAVVATSMMLLDHERKAIEEAFACKVTNRYGCEEVGLIACECDRHDGLHLNVPHLYVEFLDEDDQPVAPGEPGKIVLTDLNNRAMPLIRYRVEDIGVPSDRDCPCGRALPLLERLEGRVADFLRKPDGGRVAGISLVERTLTKIPGVEQMQLVQESLSEIHVNRVKGYDYTDATDDALLREFEEVFGRGVEIVINDVATIAQERSGKFRFSICKL